MIDIRRGSIDEKIVIAFAVSHHKKNRTLIIMPDNK
jgi:hypothetical protein